MAAKKFSKEIKVFKCDICGRFINIHFINLADYYGIVRNISFPKKPAKNSVLQRKHRHIVDIGLTMLFHAKIPLFLRVEAFLTVTFLFYVLFKDPTYIFYSSERTNA